jgi:AraC family transcriptional regulator, regulatory protein of adaptative response / DNA-3-methyladenine glycosylase II
MSENGQFDAACGASLRPMSTVTPLPDHRTCEQARLSRDPRFDGLFFTAVRSTGIYCRPVCPAPAPKPQHVVYYANAAAAEAAGFRPCLRCRPELAPGTGWRRGDALLSRALCLIEQGLLAEQPLAALAERVGVGERQLRRLFVERLGAAPIGVHGTRRLLFAKQLLTETALPITEIALAAGFGSLRRFNDAFRRAYRLAPRELRRRPRTSDANGLVLRLGYRPPYDFDALLDFLRSRALPGIETVGDGEYRRLLGPADAPGWLRLSAFPAEHALRLELHGVPAARLLEVVGRVRRMFDLDADPQAIASAFGADPLLASLVAARPGLRLPGAWDGFEAAVRAVLGQQVSVAAARTLATRLVLKHGHAVDGVDGLHCLFPTPAQLMTAELESLGVTRARAATIRAIAAALVAQEVDFAIDTPLDAFVARWTALPGIGPWTAHYIALRALSHPDAFPAEDLVLRRVAGDGAPLTARALLARAEGWRPWRGYAVIHLWRQAATVTATRTAP